MHSHPPVGVLLMNFLAIFVESNGKGSLYLHGAHKTNLQKSEKNIGQFINAYTVNVFYC